MALPKILIDSNFLYAFFRKHDENHARVRQMIETIPAIYVVPDVVLTEAAWLFNRAGGMPLVSLFLEQLVTVRFPLESVLYDDLQRASVLLRRYPHTKLEFVDCCIVALAERLNIRQVATLDRRDFSVLRKANGDFLEILP